MKIIIIKCPLYVAISYLLKHSYYDIQGKGGQQIDAVAKNLKRIDNIEKMVKIYT